MLLLFWLLVLLLLLLPYPFELMFECMLKFCLPQLEAIDEQFEQLEQDEDACCWTKEEDFFWASKIRNCCASSLSVCS